MQSASRATKGHLLVTGAAGFIGSAFARIARQQGYRVTILDALTYAGRRENLTEILAPGLCELQVGSILDFDFTDQLFQKNQFTGLIHFAAESHVDNSISGPLAFLQTNVFGTFTLLEVVRKHQPANFRFVHVSTDEVFGSLGPDGKFTETTAYAPNSPYSASKAASDHFVRAWHHTYKIPTITTNCSNNYGPRQFPEKFIPVLIHSALAGKPLPIYGQGDNIRDWIHVEDHSRGVLLAFEKGRVGESYCFGGNSERRNLDVAQSVCGILDQLRPRKDGKSYREQIQFVTDRAGHDYRYAIDDSLAVKELGFKRQHARFEDGLHATVKWYLDNTAWTDALLRTKESHK